MMKKDDILFVEECLDALETNAYDQGFWDGEKRVREPEYDTYQEKIDDLKAKILSMLEEPAPVVWRDGEVEQWKPQVMSDLETGYYWQWKEQEYPHIQWAKDIRDNEFWKKALWLPADEFPMPALPEPEIPDCPACGSVCVSTPVMVGDCPVSKVYCTNDDCLYQCDEDAHNALWRKVKHE